VSEREKKIIFSTGFWSSSSCDTHQGVGAALLLDNDKVLLLLYISHSPHTMGSQKIFFSFSLSLTLEVEHSFVREYIRRDSRVSHPEDFLMRTSNSSTSQVCSREKRSSPPTLGLDHNWHAKKGWHSQASENKKKNWKKMLLNFLIPADIS
jgi:hypothetical protein